jgi:hypothetical protein
LISSCNSDYFLYSTRIIHYCFFNIFCSWKIPKKLHIKFLSYITNFYFYSINSSPECNKSEIFFFLFFLQNFLSRLEMYWIYSLIIQVLLINRSNLSVWILFPYSSFHSHPVLFYSITFLWFSYLFKIYQQLCQLHQSWLTLFHQVFFWFKRCNCSNTDFFGAFNVHKENLVSLTFHLDFMFIYFYCMFWSLFCSDWFAEKLFERGLLSKKFLVPDQ